MTKLHEILAVERTKIAASNKLMEDAANKFKKDQFFLGFVKSLKMIQDSAENTALEESSRENKELNTTVPETLAYMFKYWNEAEDIIFTKNKTNQLAIANLEYKGSVLVENVPVDQLLGLEVRLENLRKVLELIPTHDASKEWILLDSGRLGEYASATIETTSKTEKTMTPVVLYEATEHHPAQIERVTVDKIVGTFSRKVTSGAATSKQKAALLTTIDELIVESKKARMRANSIDASPVKIGNILTDLLMDCLS